jgi:hypothetical protein
MSTRRTFLLKLLAASFILLLFAFSSSMPAQIPDNPLFKAMKWRNLGPANFSGRVVDVEALETDYRHVLVASASGGVWKSTNAGTTWNPSSTFMAAHQLGISPFSRKTRTSFGLALEKQTTVTVLVGGMVSINPSMAAGPFRTWA